MFPIIGLMISAALTAAGAIARTEDRKARDAALAEQERQTRAADAAARNQAAADIASGVGALEARSQEQRRQAEAALAAGGSTSAADLARLQGARLAADQAAMADLIVAGNRAREAAGAATQTKLGALRAARQGLGQEAAADTVQTLGELGAVAGQVAGAEGTPYALGGVANKGAEALASIQGATAEELRQLRAELKAAGRTDAEIDSLLGGAR